MMNVSWFHVSCIQETDYRLHFTCGGFLDFLEHFKHRTMRKHGLIVRKCACAFQKDQQTPRMCTIVTAALQWQYLQMELILRIRLIQGNMTEAIVTYRILEMCFIFGLGV
jgi:hypothetical protein